MGDVSLKAFDYATMLVYMGVVIAIGYMCSRKKEQSTEDYLLGGRKMPWWAIGISYYVSLLSTLSLVAVPGEAFNHGISMIFTGFISPLASILAFYIFVRFYFRAKTFTPYTYLENRFGVHIRTFAAALFWIMRVMYLAVVLYSCAIVFEGAAGWPLWFSIILVGFIGTLYTTMGGLQAVVWTDVMQFVVLVGGMVIILVACIVKVPDGLFGIIDYSFSHERGFEYFKDSRFYSLSPFIRLNLWVLIISAISSEMFNNSCDQLSIQRLLSTSSYQQAKKSLFTYAFIAFPWGFVMYLVGLAVFVFYAYYPAGVELNGDTALFRFIATELPSPLPGIIISAMLAAVMSTLDSGINSLATVATKDFYLRIFRPHSNEDQQVSFSKIMTIVIGIIAVSFSLIIASANTQIGQTMMEVTSLWFAYFNVVWPIFFLGVTSCRINSRHILACILASWLVTTSMVIIYVKTKGTDHELSFMLISTPGMLVMIILGYILALFSKPVAAVKTNGLTLWTLKKSVNDTLAPETQSTDVS